jgi:hypothetical protein
VISISFFAISGCSIYLEIECSFSKEVNMKITQSKVNIAPVKEPSKMSVNLPKAVTPKINLQKPAAGPMLPLSRPTPEKMQARPLPPVSNMTRPAPSTMKDDYSSLKDAAMAVQRIKISAQQELDQIRKMRADAIRYQLETATRARSKAHQLILHSRLETQREIEELIRQASEEIQKVLADIRVIRITAQEELAAQRKFTDAAKISSMSLSIKEEMAGTERKKKRQLVAAKA